MADETGHPEVLVPVRTDLSQLPDERDERPGMALCLSGGGYRAMLFHLGGIIRLNELGHLRTVQRISSVSGGSITAGALGVAWNQLTWDASSVAQNLNELVIDRIRSLARDTIDKGAVLGGLLLPGKSISDNVQRAYDKHLFDNKTLKDLPTDQQGPRFIINATNVQTGKLFRFSRPYMGDYTVGLWRDPDTSIADAVTASSAFPPVLSPHVIKPTGTFDTTTEGVNRAKAFRKKIWLSDGGVYDNLGLETAWKTYRTILVSDGGGRLDADPKPKRNWAQHGIRVSGIVDGQVRALRKRQLITGYEQNIKDGSYWGIRSDIGDYHLPTSMPFPVEQAEIAVSTPTRLAALDEQHQADLINWGYVIADTAIRKWVDTTAAPPTKLPA